MTVKKFSETITFLNIYLSATDLFSSSLFNPQLSHLANKCLIVDYYNNKQQQEKTFRHYLCQKPAVRGGYFAKCGNVMQLRYFLSSLLVTVVKLTKLFSN